nr:hypothetical protein [Thiobacillus sp.]
MPDSTALVRVSRLPIRRASKTTQLAPELPCQPATLQPFASASRAKHGKQKRAAQHQGGMASDTLKCSHAAVRQRQACPPWLDVLRQAGALGRSERHQLLAAFG